MSHYGHLKLNRSEFHISYDIIKHHYGAIGIECDEIAEIVVQICGTMHEIQTALFQLCAYSTTNFENKLQTMLQQYHHLNFWNPILK